MSSFSDISTGNATDFKINMLWHVHIRIGPTLGNYYYSVKVTQALEWPNGEIDTAQ